MLKMRIEWLLSNEQSSKIRRKGFFYRNWEIVWEKIKKVDSINWLK